MPLWWLNNFTLGLRRNLTSTISHSRSNFSSKRKKDQAPVQNFCGALQPDWNYEDGLRIAKKMVYSIFTDVKGDLATALDGANTRKFRYLPDCLWDEIQSLWNQTGENHYKTRKQKFTPSSMNRQRHEIHHTNTSLFENTNLCKAWPKDFKILIYKRRNTAYDNESVFWHENSKSPRNAEVLLKQKCACFQWGKKTVNWGSPFIDSDRKMQYCKNYMTTMGWGRTQSKHVSNKREEGKQRKRFILSFY